MLLVKCIIYSGSKKYCHISLIFNQTSSYQVIYLIFIVASFCNHMKVLLHDTKFNILESN